MRRLGVPTALAAGFAVLLAGGATAAAPLRALTITPAVAEGTSYPGQRIGPFTIINSTGRTYSVGVVPVLLGQRVDGSFFVRGDPASRARAGRFLDLVDRTTFALSSGESHSITSTLDLAPPRRDFYGGVLFRGVPAEPAPGTGFVQALQLNARVSLRPPVELQRIEGQLGSLRAEQAGPGRLQLLVRFANRGNVDVRPEGTVEVLDETGNTPFRHALRSVTVIPGYEVDLPATLSGPVLPRGVYTLRAQVRAGGKDYVGRGALRLFGPNEVATRRAKIVFMKVKDVYVGRDAQVEVTYRNTGNVTFRPTVSVDVAGRSRGIPLVAESVAPGKQGTATGTIRFDDTQSHEVSARLAADGRVQDVRAVSVAAVERPALRVRVEDWVITNSLVLLGALAGLTATLLVLVTTMFVRRQAKA
jgi:hypothetical protein